MFGSGPPPGQLLVLSMLVCTGCSSSGQPGRVDASSDVSVDVAAIDAADPDQPADQNAPDSKAPVTPTDYCEAVADGFCAFYLRCERMVVKTAEQCREVFLETCNERYEPVYAALADAKLLSLSNEGLTACMAHLATVQCDQQIRDLDGACGQVWLGHQPAGKPCGIGIESFICEPGTSCKLSLDLCGVCTTVAPLGQPCGAGHDVVCGQSADCIEGSCRASIMPGQACDKQNRCVLGASCVDAICQPPTFGVSGVACNSAHRCQYRTACVGGSCHDTAMLGDSCDATTACDSGRCASSPNGPICEPRLAAGQACSAHADCLSGRCMGGKCDAIVGKCF